MQFSPSFESGKFNEAKVIKRPGIQLNLWIDPMSSLVLFGKVFLLK